MSISSWIKPLALQLWILRAYTFRAYYGNQGPREQMWTWVFPLIAGASPTSTGDCQEGYYCELGAFTPTPTDGFTGEECPEGHYCVRGTPAPESCPPGTFSNALGLRSIQECTNCTPGLFCNGTALTAPSGDCWPRYYCSGKAEHPAPQDGITGGNCTPGHFCPGRTPNPIPCQVNKEDEFNLLHKMH